MSAETDNLLQDTFILREGGTEASCPYCARYHHSGHSPNCVWNRRPPVSAAAQPVAWRNPHLLTFKGAIRTSCPADLQEDIEGTVGWTVSLFPDVEVVDKHGVLHKPQPLYASPPPASAPSDDLPGSLALAQAVSKGEWPHTMDARVWAREFHRRHADLDEGYLLSWFADAIMAGYDTAMARQPASAPEPQRAVVPDGFRLVPVEATGEMLLAWDQAAYANDGYYTQGERMKVKYRAMLAAAPQPPSAWQPIESAPKDGTHILGLTDSGYAVVATWLDIEHIDADEGSGFYVSWNHDSLVLDSWMPLPQPPEGST